MKINRVMRISVFSLLALLTVAPILTAQTNQRKKKAAPADLTKPPLIEADLSVLPKNMEQVDLFILMGQSNMKGHGVMPAEPLNSPQIINMHMVTDDWFLARHPLHLTGDPKDFSGANNAGVGPGLAFAQKLAEAQPKTRIALIPCAVGGSSVGQWSKGRGNYEAAVRRAKLALEMGPKGKTRLAGILWHQGESDSTSEKKVAAYSQKLGQMIDDLRQDLGVSDLPFIACTIGEKKNPKVRAALNAKLLNLPSLRPNTACADGRSHASYVDAVHFDTAAQDKFGSLYAEEYLKLTQPNSN